MFLYTVLKALEVPTVLCDSSSTFDSTALALRNATIQSVSCGVAALECWFSSNRI